MIATHDDDQARLRWGIYLLLIAVAVGNMSGRLLAVNSVDRAGLERHRIDQRLAGLRERLAEEGLADQAIEDRLAAEAPRLRRQLRLQRPFLSANDRSRWMTVRSLVEHGTYAIDPIVGQPTWDTIDMVRHRGRDGRPHLYSSKPPLLATLLAGEYWLIHQVTGWTLADQPYAVGRLMLITVNVLPLVLMFVIVACLAERLGTTDWGRIFVVATATLGTLLTPFAVVLNNHLVAAVSAAVAIYALVRIGEDAEAESEPRWRWFVLAGLAAALTAANELPALSLLAAVGLLLGWQAPRPTWLAFIPAAAVVGAAFFATNYAAHQSLRPPYMHRSATDPDDNWYDYQYTVDGQVRESYWRDRQGIDRGEPSRWDYAWHVLVGHHGIVSLTPVWLLSAWGALRWMRSGQPLLRHLALLIAGLTIVCLVFYIGLRPQPDRNYGGMTSGFRWMLWFAPLWAIAMLPAADRLARSAAGMALAAMLLSVSVFSASFPTWNPWTHPWIYRWLEWCGWQGF